MKRFIRTTAFIMAAAATSTAWSQITPDLVDSTGREVGRFKGDSVTVLYSGQVVRIYVDAHWDYTQGRPLSSGLTWKHVPLYYATADCSGQAYMGTSPTAPVASGAAAPAAGAPYTQPAYGSHFLFAPSKVGTAWTAYISGENPTFQQVAIQSERQYDGSCAAKSYPNLWVTPVVTQTGLEIYGVPPFYVK
ncbi:hypothetical protein SAMN06265795_109115 [Noviherbaspirillum humi]|uniref:Uncharacterized protein n=1 Tax=Noviherbaspirillum humi TaxID=1688639 RepID=A0A239IH46_9BURK|nr:hypothetical protein [Noviherbaspirillum humi]SNS93056.1 hypothetical protein SAMN06265795_109115 [Noviherbaspirillum humi]